MSERGGRYQRSAPGLVGALIVTLLLVGGFVLLRSVGREDQELRPDAVDYRETVQLAQAERLEVVYPGTLPEGWIATSVDLAPGSPPAWGVGMLTDGGRFAGIRQEDASLEELLERYVDEEVADEGTTQLPGTLPGPWQRFSDEGGDTAYATERGDQVVLVYGSAPAADLRALVAALTTRPL